MLDSHSYGEILASSERAAWAIEDVIAPTDRLDFTLPFLPEAIARSASTPELAPDEQLTLNHIRAHEYLSIFGLVEEFILPFVLDHARPQLDEDDDRTRALLNFACEEAKHIHLFKRFHAAFRAGFGHDCEVIGPPQAVAAKVLAHDPLAVALLILHIEWMSQRHYVESVRDDGRLDPLFKSLLKHHWMEEAGHAKLDQLMVHALAGRRDAAGIAAAVDEYVEIVRFFDVAMRDQAAFNLAALEGACGRSFAPDAEDDVLAHQHQALRLTYLGSGMTHPKFRATLGAVSPAALARIDALAWAYC